MQNDKADFAQYDTGVRVAMIAAGLDRFSQSALCFLRAAPWSKSRSCFSQKSKRRTSHAPGDPSGPELQPQKIRLRVLYAPRESLT
jgi:hypothetical protein